MIAQVRRGAHRVEPYTLPDHQLAVGSTLGSPKAVLVVKATGALEKLYSCEAGTDVFGTLLVRHWDAHSGVALRRQSGSVVIAPERQEHHLEYSEGIAACERIFTLNAQPRGADPDEIDPPAAYYDVELRNEGDRTVELASYAAIRLRGGFRKDTSVNYDESNAAFIVRNADSPQIVRIAASSVPPVSYEVTTDNAKVCAAEFPGTLANRTIRASEDPIALFHLEHRLEPGQRAGFYFVLTFSLEGEPAARRALTALPPCHEALERTQAHYSATLDRAICMTPDEQINRGVFWAKVNMLRSFQLTNQGWSFVNDPTQTTKSVARDTCWFALGADYVAPWFARESLLWFVDHLTNDGMAVEWYDNRSGDTETYGLDINDNTPLLILALRHHCGVTGDREFLQSVYPKAARAARYILSKRGARGLVWCHAPGEGSRGILGWRNAIQDHRLAGATTELNSECYAALRAISVMAREIGDLRASDEFERHATQLRSSINEHLLDTSRKLYYLTIDNQGRPHTDVTCDLVFPVLFGVADDDVATNVIAALSRPEFWTDAGLRTVPRDSINYGPKHASGLLGGVWAAPTFWFAAAAARFNADFMAQALAATFAHYAQDPLRYNTVPGQFCEWLDGETLTNQGMLLSPWFAPKYLWAAIEGAAGLSTDCDAPTARARLADQWQWLGVRNVRLRGEDASWFTVRMREPIIYATTVIASVDSRHRYDADVSDAVRASGEGIEWLALQRDDALAILLGNTTPRTSPTAVILEDVRLPQQVKLRVYSSLYREWKEEGSIDSSRLRQGFPLELDRRGFCVLEVDCTPSS